MLFQPILNPNPDLHPDPFTMIVGTVSHWFAHAYVSRMAEETGGGVEGGAEANAPSTPAKGYSEANTTITAGVGGGSGGSGLSADGFSVGGGGGGGGGGMTRSRSKSSLDDQPLVNDFEPSEVVLHFVRW